MLKRSDDAISHFGLLGFWNCSIVKYSEITQRFLNWNNLQVFFNCIIIVIPQLDFYYSVKILGHI